MKFLNIQQVSLFLIILLFTTSCTKREISSDKIQNRNGIYYAVNENDPYSGIVLTKDKDGQIFVKKEYKNGILDGKTEKWYSNGQKRSEEVYSKGKRNGVFIEWTKNGQKVSETNYKDDKLDGKVERWYSNSQKRSEEVYSKGKRNGVFIEWTENGQKVSETSYKDDKLDGKVEMWDSNGQKISEITYKDGKLEFLIRDGKKIELGELKDIDGNVYTTIKIGNQEWMVENLKVTRYRNGDPIPNVTSRGEWKNLNSGAYCAYENNSDNIETYGLLYNWYAVSVKRNICPKGWHIPTDAEWKILIDYLGGESVAGGKMKTKTSHWKIPNTGATNKSGFSALPGGSRYGSGEFLDLGNDGSWWSATEFNSYLAYRRYLSYDGASVSRYDSYKSAGFSVRCVRD